MLLSKATDNMYICQKKALPRCRYNATFINPLLTRVHAVMSIY